LNIFTSFFKEFVGMAWGLCYFYRLWGGPSLNFFNFDLRKLVVVVLIVAVPLISINMQRESKEMPWFLRPFSAVSSLMQRTYSSFSTGVRGTTSLYLDLVGIKKENRQLWEKNAQLRAQLGSMTELELENERLNNLLQFKQKSNMDLLAAKVIGNDLLPNHSTITINRGSQHGVTRTMAAITIGGVVGYVLRAEPYSAQILLLTDRYIAIDAIVQRSRARGVIEGKSKGVSQLRYLQRSDDVKEGDLVVTSGLDNIFPKGFPIGLVTHVEKSQYGMSQEVIVKPTVNPMRLEEIFVVLNAQHENFNPKPKESNHSEKKIMTETLLQSKEG
jgi:rod shape-determining protein MreC